MGNYDDPQLTGSGPPRRNGWVLGGLAVLLLLLGLAGGYVLGARGSTGEPTAAAPTTSPAPPTTRPPVAAPSPPCLAAGEAGAAVLEQVERAVRAIGDLDPAALRAVLDTLQPLQGELERAVAACYGGIAPNSSTSTPTTPTTSSAPPT